MFKELAHLAHRYPEVKRIKYNFFKLKMNEFLQISLKVYGTMLSEWSTLSGLNQMGRANNGDKNNDEFFKFLNRKF